ncbi:hypothetical protein [Rhodococcus sp. 008]|uniref:hypothetical protein n=1 Tax=Rhodococcus sp. 008 TaxID=1723645 RepID=UPI0012E99CFB|nr:hypothetical protein [Rhodococcus sp. 008]
MLKHDETPLPNLSVYVAGAPETIDAAKALSGLTSLLDLIKELQQFSEGPEGHAGHTRWRLSQLELNSIATTFSPLRSDDDSDQTIELSLSNLIRGFQVTEGAAEIPDYWPTTAVEKARKAAYDLGAASPAGTEISIPGSENLHVRVSSQSARNIRTVVNQKTKSLGSVTGTIETLTVRKKNEAHMWTERGNHRVTVRFSEKDFEAVRAAIKHRVLIYGILERNYRSAPVSVDLRNIEVLEEWGSGPKLTDLGGSSPEYIGGQHAVDYVRQSRDRT